MKRFTVRLEFPDYPFWNSALSPATRGVQLVRFASPGTIAPPPTGSDNNLLPYEPPGLSSRHFQKITILGLRIFQQSLRALDVIRRV
jgi:hypothetical protein